VLAAGRQNLQAVIPAKAGIHLDVREVLLNQIKMDPSFRWDDGMGCDEGLDPGEGRDDGGSVCELREDFGRRQEAPCSQQGARTFKPSFRRKLESILTFARCC
jgi:hypothetical protein